MKKQMKKNHITIIIILMSISFLGVCPVSATESTSKDMASDFIEKVIPVDFAKYNVTFSKYSEKELPEHLSGSTVSEIVTYSLESKENKFDVICKIKNNILTYCLIENKNGLIANKHPNLIDASYSFIENYQKFNGEDLTELKSMLLNAEEKNSTVFKGNIKLLITNFKTEVMDQTTFRWIHTVNGVEYTELSLTYENGSFYSMSDNRGIYSIGDTDVDISKEEAIKIAMKYIEGYSYTVPSGKISDFNVTEERTEANLKVSVRENNALYPAWQVLLYLNQTYPGSVFGLQVYIWADSGEVLSCSNRATGGIISDGDTNESESSQISEESGNSLQNTYILSAIAITGIIGLTTYLMLKKR